MFAAATEFCKTDSRPTGPSRSAIATAYPQLSISIIGTPKSSIADIRNRSASKVTASKSSASEIRRRSMTWFHPLRREHRASRGRLESQGRRVVVFAFIARSTPAMTQARWVTVTWHVMAWHAVLCNREPSTSILKHHSPRLLKATVSPR